jgi:hypothetical protein
VIGIVVGIGMIVVGYTWQFNNISYPPGDPRGEAWYGATFFAIAAGCGVFVLIVFSIRLMTASGAPGGCVRDRLDGT